MKWRHWLRLWPARSRRLRTARPCVPTVVWCARFFEFEILLCALRAASKTITLNLAALCQSRWRSRLGRKDRQSMIGEGIQSTNQRKHSYVRDNVEVGFFTDPTVCIGCKACEVACKEWNEVPGDGYVWFGNSYDNTGHLGASTWRHVMFLEQDRQKGNQVVGCHSLGNGDKDDPFRWVFLSDVCKHLRGSRLPRSMSDRLNRPHRGRLGTCARRCVQRLRILRRLLSIWRDRS